MSSISETNILNFFLDTTNIKTGNICSNIYLATIDEVSSTAWRICKIQQPYNSKKNDKKDRSSSLILDDG